MQSKKSVILLLLAMLLVSLACSFSFNADFSGDNKSAEDQNVQDNEANEIEPSEDLDETNSNDNPVEIEATENEASGDVPQAGRQLRDADETFEAPPDQNEFSSPAGQIYVEILIKSGPDISSYLEDTNDGCVEIIGLGTSTVVVNRVGEGRDCKEFGGIGLIYGE